MLHFIDGIWYKAQIDLEKLNTNINSYTKTSLLNDTELKELEQYNNIKFIRDFGNPVRCSQMGVALAEGEYLFWGAGLDYLNKNHLCLAVG